jgi:hypothetical protein
MKRVALIVSWVSLLALLLVSCESYQPPGVENASPVGPTSEGNLIPEEPGAPQTTDAIIHRPITDFLEAQETESHIVWPFGDIAGFSGHPPGWSNPMGWPYYYPYWVYVDWCNLVDPWLYEEQGIDLGTVISGDITEQSLPGGGRRVHITLQGTNCWTIANVCDYSLGPVRWPIVLGYAPEHIFQPGETPLVSGCNMLFKWTDDYDLYGPLPVMLEVFNGIFPPNFYIESLTLNSNSGTGPLTNQPAYEEWGLTPWETGMVGSVEVHQLAIKGGSVWPNEICDVGPMGNP